MGCIAFLVILSYLGPSHHSPHGLHVDHPHGLVGVFVLLVVLAGDLLHHLACPGGVDGLVPHQVHLVGLYLCHA